MNIKIRNPFFHHLQKKMSPTARTVTGASDWGKRGHMGREIGARGRVNDIWRDLVGDASCKGKRKGFLVSDCWFFFFFFCSLSQCCCWLHVDQNLCKLLCFSFVTCIMYS